MKRPSKQFQRSRRPTIQRAELMEIIRREPSLHGEVGLWLVILFDVITALRKEPETRQDREDQELARKFVMERGGVFEHALAILGLEPEYLRERVLGNWYFNGL